MKDRDKVPAMNKVLHLVLRIVERDKLNCCLSKAFIRERWKRQREKIREMRTCISSTIIVMWGGGVMQIAIVKSLCSSTVVDQKAFL